MEKRIFQFLTENIPNEKHNRHDQVAVIAQV